MTHITIWRRLRNICLPMIQLKLSNPYKNSISHCQQLSLNNISLVFYSKARAVLRQKVRVYTFFKNLVINVWPRKVTLPDSIPPCFINFLLYVNMNTCMIPTIFYVCPSAPRCCRILPFIQKSASHFSGKILLLKTNICVVKDPTGREFIGTLTPWKRKCTIYRSGTHHENPQFTYFSNAHNRGRAMPFENTIRR